MVSTETLRDMVSTETHVETYVKYLGVDTVEPLWDMVSTETPKDMVSTETLWDL